MNEIVLFLAIYLPATAFFICLGLWVIDRSMDYGGNFRNPFRRQR